VSSHRANESVNLRRENHQSGTILPLQRTPLQHLCFKPKSNYMAQEPRTTSSCCSKGTIENIPTMSMTTSQISIDLSGRTPSKSRASRRVLARRADCHLPGWAEATRDSGSVSLLAPPRHHADPRRNRESVCRGRRAWMQDSKCRH